MKDCVTNVYIEILKHGHRISLCKRYAGVYTICITTKGSSTWSWKWTLE